MKPVFPARRCENYFGLFKCFNALRYGGTSPSHATSGQMFVNLPFVVHWVLVKIIIDFRSCTRWVARWSRENVVTTQPRETQYIFQGNRRSISQGASIYHFVRSMSMSFNFNSCFVDGQHNVLRETFTCRNPNVYSSKHAREYPHSRQVRTTTCILINNLCDFVHTYRRLLCPQLERGGSGKPCWNTLSKC